jgi:hypothetical protein
MPQQRGLHVRGLSLANSYMRMRLTPIEVA